MMMMGYDVMWQMEAAVPAVQQRRDGERRGARTRSQAAGERAAPVRNGMLPERYAPALRARLQVDDGRQ